MPTTAATAPTPAASRRGCRSRTSSTGRSSEAGGVTIEYLFGLPLTATTKKVVVPGKPRARSAWGADPGPITPGRRKGQLERHACQPIAPGGYGSRRSPGRQLSQ
ncbi:hypothetical protein BRAO375_1410002 [Bradyrhizobium sp. ORS 375]|nr:hypothetical protein BRAO375_1410002 [Bradyrhizobium sp. ORS 375]